MHPPGVDEWAPIEPRPPQAGAGMLAAGFGRPSTVECGPPAHPRRGGGNSDGRMNGKGMAVRPAVGER